MDYVMNAGSLKFLIVGVEYVTFNGISKIGLAETMMLIGLFEKRNRKLYARGKFQSGLSMIDLKILNIWLKEDLELFIRQFGKMDLLRNGILKIINGKDGVKIIQL